MQTKILNTWSYGLLLKQANVFLKEIKRPKLDKKEEQIQTKLSQNQADST